MRAQKLTLAALALAAGLTLTACQGNDDAAAGKDDAASSAGSSASDGAQGNDGGSGSDEKDPSASGDATATETGGGSDDGSGGGQITTGPCKTADLTFRTSHGMAEGNLMVVMKNTGGDACSLKGFPGVDLKADNGPGAISAERSKLTAPPVAVKPGEETRFTLHYPRNDSGGSGVNITSIVVTPPEETHSTTLPVELNLPVTDGSGTPVTVDPVGTGKQ